MFQLSNEGDDSHKKPPIFIINLQIIVYRGKIVLVLK